MDGFSLIRTARAEGVQTPVLMLTARDAGALLVTALRLFSHAR
jgi:DNA-binding response OmpR family regulator